MNNIREISKQDLIRTIKNNFKKSISKKFPKLKTEIEEFVSSLNFDTENFQKLNEKNVKMILDRCTAQITQMRLSDEAEENNIKDLEEFSRICSMFFTRAY